ncbi:hypothetical protein ABW20_dc0103185 [Dactylellina cionopaga]|nr:hypothetical protein ABW20_dc0103185 [Dactylellina cionopaga]
MANSEYLKSPFKPEREKHPVIYCKMFQVINDARLIDHHDKGILLAVLAFTTNNKLFRTFDKLSVSDLKDLANLSEIALKNLRNWGIGLLSTLGLLESSPELPSTSLSRSARFGDDCLKRQQGICLLTGTGFSSDQQNAHIFPHSSLNYTKAATSLTWRFILIFLGAANANILADELWSKESGIHTTKNGISFFPNEHGFFDNGKLSLIPVCLTKNHHDYLDVEVGLYSAAPAVEIISTSDKLNVEEQYNLQQDEMPKRAAQDPRRFIKDGDMVRITTPDPLLLPLPSPILLYWHRHLWSTLTSAGLSTPQSGNRREDWRDLSLRKRTSAQRLRNSPLGGSSNSRGEGSSGGVGQGCDGVDEPKNYTDEDLRIFYEREARFLEGLRRLTVPADGCSDGYRTDYSDDYYY